MSWDSFVPDLIVGAVTGALVGVALLLIQRNVERRGARSLARRESIRLVQPLLLALQSKRYQKGFADVAMLPAKHREAFLLIDEARLDEWNETLPTPLTVALMKYRSRLRDWTSDARALDEAVEFHSKRWTTTPGVEAWVRARILGAGSLELKALTPAGVSYSDLLSAGERALGSRGVRTRAASYRQALHRTTKAADELIPILVRVIRVQRTSSNSSGLHARWTLSGRAGGGFHGPWSGRCQLPRKSFGLVVVLCLILAALACSVVATASADVVVGAYASALHLSPVRLVFALAGAVGIMISFVSLLMAISFRLRDAGSLQWWLLLVMLPILGWALIVFVLARPSAQAET